MKIKFSILAKKDMQSVWEYISKDNVQAAQQVMDRVLNTVSHMETFPAIGVMGRVQHTREFKVANTPLMIVYKIRHDTLFIVRILHSAQKWPRP